jgi:site-specific recombinase XerD
LRSTEHAGFARRLWRTRRRGCCGGGGWMKSRRPRPSIEAIDAELLTLYLGRSAHFRAKTTVYGTLSTMRCFGDYLVREGLWRQNPLRWMKGPKVTPYSRLPRRIDRSHMEALWRAAARTEGEFSRTLWVAVLALLYGTDVRRGELERRRYGSGGPIWDSPTSVRLSLAP